jgi:hypothetical protein
MLLSREASEILLPFLQSAGFGVRRSLEIHSEPENGDHHPATPAATFCATFQPCSRARSLIFSLLAAISALIW